MNKKNRPDRTALICACALVIVFALTAVLFSLGTVLHTDMTWNGMFTLDEDVTAMLRSVDQDVSLLYLASELDQDVRVTEVLEKIAAENTRIKLFYVSADEMARYTSAQLNPYSVVVYGGDNVVAVDYAEIYSYDTLTMGQYTVVKDLYFAAEKQIANAIEYAVSELPMAYLLTGHGEALPDSGFMSLFNTAAYHVMYLNLTDGSEIPEDAELIMINVPQTDLRDGEAEKLTAWLDNGGCILLTADGSTMPGANMSKLGEHVGIGASAGVLVERDAGHLLAPDYPYYLMTDLNTEVSEFAGMTETGEQVLVALAYALETGEANGYTVQSVLMTSEQAYLKPDAYADGNTAYTEGDRTGPFCVAAMATGSEGGKLFYASSRQCFSDTANNMVNGMNYRLAGRLFSGLSEDPYTLTAAGLQSPSMMPEQVQPEPAQRTVLMTVMIAIPVLTAAAGIVVAARFGRKPAPVIETVPEETKA